MRWSIVSRWDTTRSYQILAQHVAKFGGGMINMCCNREPSMVYECEFKLEDRLEFEDHLKFYMKPTRFK